MSWISLALALVKLANYLFENHKTAAQEQVGEDRERLRQFTAMQEISAKLKEVDERFDKMTDAEIKVDIESKNDFRD